MLTNLQSYILSTFVLMNLLELTSSTSYTRQRFYGEDGNERWNGDLNNYGFNEDPRFPMRLSIPHPPPIPMHIFGPLIQNGKEAFGDGYGGNGNTYDGQIRWVNKESYSGAPLYDNDRSRESEDAANGYYGYIKSYSRGG